jgi:UrcA family protein
MMIIRTLIAAALLLPLAGTANAQQIAPTHTLSHTRDLNRTVQISDTDLTAQAWARLRSDIRVAAHRVCNVYTRRPLSAIRLERNCIEQATRQGMAQLERRYNSASQNDRHRNHLHN